MKIILFIFFIFLTINNYSQSFSDNELVAQITKALIDSYDQKPTDSQIETLLKQIGKKNYIHMLNLWKKNYTNIYSMQFEMDPVTENIIKIIKKNSSPLEALNFQEQREKLMRISMENFQMYLNAIKEQPGLVELNQIDCDYINKCLTNQKYYDIQVQLYSKETFITNRIYSIMTGPQVKSKLWFYNFLYKLLMKYRQKTINRLLTETLSKINDKSITK